MAATGGRAKSFNSASPCPYCPACRRPRRARPKRSAPWISGSRGCGVSSDVAMRGSETGLSWVPSNPALQAKVYNSQDISPRGTLGRARNTTSAADLLILKADGLRKPSAGHRRGASSAAAFSCKQARRRRSILLDEACGAAPTSTLLSLRRIGARGGRAYGRNRRAHQKLQLSVRAFRQVSKEIHGPAGGRVSHLEAPAGIEFVGANITIPFATADEEGRAGRHSALTHESTGSKTRTTLHNVPTPGL